MDLKPVHRRIVQRYLAILDSLQTDVREVTAEVHDQARQDPRARLLMTIPGIGTLTALLFLAEVGDLNRFPDATKLVSFAGLAPRVRASGGKVRLGHITKQGSSWLRWTFTEAAARTGASQDSLGRYYRHIKGRHGSQTAITALARKLLTIAYFVVKTGRPYEERG